MTQVAEVAVNRALIKVVFVSMEEKGKHNSNVPVKIIQAKPKASIFHGESCRLILLFIINKKVYYVFLYILVTVKTPF